MSDYPAVIATVRDSVVGILRIHTVRVATVKKGKQRPPSFNVAFVGTGFCVSSDRLIFTAFHVLNQGKPRDPADRFYVFYAPNNGARAYNREVVGVPYEDQTLDVAIVEIAPCQPGQPSVTFSPVTFSPILDGAPVLTYGFPAPAIVGASLDPSGRWMGGNIFLMSHGNEGIVSSQYELNGALHYELNVGWHHGESGGPIFRTADPVSAFALMQGYRNIQSPHGTVAGPHIGRALRAAEPTLRRLGATIVG
jgi:hypothetical protein